jgi:hypothetical protein
MRYAVVLAFLLDSVALVEAQPITSYMGDGNDVLRLCSAPQGVNGCIAYIAGVVDAMAGGNPVGGWRACIPQGVITGQLRDITVNYLGSHPNQRHLLGSHLVAASIATLLPETVLGSAV